MCDDDFYLIAAYFMTLDNSRSFYEENSVLISRDNIFLHVINHPHNISHFLSLPDTDNIQEPDVGFFPWCLVRLLTPITLRQPSLR
jgi:hypothetical protein